MTDASTHLLVLLAISWIYLTLVRFVDVNEREPVWSLAVAFALGAAAAALVRLLVDPVTMVLSPWAGAAAEEIAKGLAYAGTLLIFVGMARVRGWFELSDLVDGIVYGITIGLGFSVSEGFLRDLSLSPADLGALAWRPGAALVNGALSGLGHGLFGGVTGLGIGLAVESHGRLRRTLLAVLALAAAIALNAGFRILAHGNALGGQMGIYRAWLAVLIPVAALVAIGLLGLHRERRIIARELDGELADQTVAPGDLALLTSFWQRQLGYLRLLAAGKVHECLVRAGRHNRQVQLALVKARVRGEDDPRHVASLTRQIEALRRAIRRSGTLVVLLALAGVLSAGIGIRVPFQLIKPPSAGVLRVLGLAVPELDKYWRKQLFPAYVAPLVGPYTLFNLKCPFESGNAEFCLGDGNIYYDPGFLNELHDSIGDFAPALVIAHEFGHKVQRVRGLKPGTWTIQSELQADCYAGEWVAKSDAGKMLQKGDLGEALEVLNRGRDPRHQPWYNPQAHGTGGQRVDAFQAGREGIACDSDALWIEVHLDPAVYQQNATPVNGSLLTGMPKQKGRFVLVSVTPLPDLIKLTRTDAVRSIYRAPDGAEVVVVTAAYVSAEAAEGNLGVDSTDAIGKGYAVVNKGPIKDGDREIGRWVLLEGPRQAMLLINGRIGEVMMAPKDLAWEFANGRSPAP